MKSELVQPMCVCMKSEVGQPLCKEWVGSTFVYVKSVGSTFVCAKLLVNLCVSEE